jgi:transcriptional regulator with XRE-family HTH domain
MTAAEMLASGMSPLSIQLRKIRENRKPPLSQTALAKLADVRRATICDIENGKAKALGLDTLEKIAKALGVSALDLLEETPAKPKPRTITVQSSTETRLIPLVTYAPKQKAKPRRKR